MSSHNRFAAVLSVVALSGLASAARAQVPSFYNITDLGTLANSTITPTAINASGVVVGFSNVPTLNSNNQTVSSPHAFKTGPNGAGGVQDMGLLPYLPGTVAGTYARGINDSGLITGYGTTAVPAASTKSNYNHVFISKPNSNALTDIGTLGPTTITLASGTTTANNAIGYGVSNSGYVTGYGTDAQNGATTAVQFHAFRFNSNTESALSSADDLGTMGTGLYSYGYAVNNAGTVVGRANINTGNFIHAFRDNVGGSMQDLGTLGTTNTTNSISSEALAINTTGTIVGDSYDNNYVQQAYVLRADENGITTADKLFKVNGDVIGGIGSAATGINDAGEIVGYFNVDTTLTTYVYHAFVYTGTPATNGTAYDLNNYLNNGAGWLLQYAEGVNSSGQITGYGTIGGQTHAFLLTATPAATAVLEPGALALLVGSALSGAGFLARRKRAAK